MSITHKSGDIFTTSQPAVIHGVNIRGVMGSGIAKTVRMHYPDVYSSYREYCLAGKLQAGGLFPFFGHDPSGKTDSRWILNAASQDDPGPSATYEWLQESVRRAFDFATRFNLSGVAICRIGAGIGGLDWAPTLSIIEQLSREFPTLEVEIWTYDK